ncbi:MAG: PA14 domain-containing protein [Planctomycetaceae bacterium]
MLRQCASWSAALWMMFVLTNDLESLSPLYAQDDADNQNTTVADDELQNGLIVTYRTDSAEVQQLDDLVSVDWRERAPDPRLSAKKFSADWNGRLLVRQEGKYRFHAYVAGRIKVKLGERVLLEGERETADWIPGEEFDLDFGEPDFHVHFEKTAPQARIHLFWSSDAFPLEPISASVLFCDPLSESVRQIDKGRKLFEVHRCGRCHRRDDEPLPPPAPSLEFAANHVSTAWLTQKLLAHRTSEPPEPNEIAKEVELQSSLNAFADKMPEFQLTMREALGIATFLRKNSKPLELPPFPAVEDPLTYAAEGHHKLLSLGCLGCHHIEDQYAEVQVTQLWNGGSLAGVGLKRSPEWLLHWLKRPKDLNADHRMPTFTLDDKELQQLVLALMDLKRSPHTDSISNEDTTIDPFDTELIELGAKVLHQRRCTACHQVPQLNSVVGDPKLQLAKPLTAKSIDWKSSCVYSNKTRENQPRYVGLDREAIQAYVESRRDRLSPTNLDMQGRIVIEQNGCLACHPRSTSLGMTPLAGRLANENDPFRGRSSELIPPSLTAVGDKLFDTALAEAVSGMQPVRRLPWLQIRMPKFEHTPEAKSNVIEYLIGKDRIPDHPPATPTIKADIPLPQQVLAGHTLVGARGFSCIACHSAGKFQPRGVALGSRGSDLLMLQTRMRKEYFSRWTRSPLRIVPGTEMPSYQRPVKNVLDENLDAQLEAVWLGLNDSNFTIPTNPGSVEQYLVMKPGDRPRIVRDVFTTSNAAGEEFVPRAFAVGLANGHSLLFDLDRGALRQWTIGDFARQRTQGKSWFWDMAGLSLMSDMGQRSDLVLIRKGKAKVDAVQPPIIDPTTVQEMASRLVEYNVTADDVMLTYRMSFTDGKNTFDVTVSEVFTAASSAGDHPSSTTGWSRRIQVADVPETHGVLIRRPHAKKVFGEAAVIATAPWKTRDALSLISSVSGTKTSPTQRNKTFESRPPRGASNVAATAIANRTPEISPDEFAELTPMNDLNQSDRKLWQTELKYRCALTPDSAVAPAVPNRSPPQPESIKTVPGFEGIRLPLDTAIMPTAITWTSSGAMAFTSLKGDVYIAEDTDGDGNEDKLTLFEDGLAAPFGIVADGDELIVAHKPELIRLRDTDGDGHADHREVLATGWGYSEDYHDWTCGIVRDSQDRLYVALGSDYGQPNRPRNTIQWRGKVLRVDPDGTITPLGHDLRFPTGLAIDCQDRILISDQQGLQNTFNELNLLIDGAHYGVPSLSELEKNSPGIPPAIQIPHPWTRSVNGIQFLPMDSPIAAWQGQGIGCEYDTRFLIRFSIQQVDDAVQGAIYPMSLPQSERGGENFVGPICVGVSPNGGIYIGSIHDSGWQGGINTGAIERLRFSGDLPLGIREVKAFSHGFEVGFTAPLDSAAVGKSESYTISGYTRVYQGGYATPDSGRYQPKIERVEIFDDRQTVRLHLDELKTGYVYEIHCGKIGPDAETSLWPNEAHYTLHRIPQSDEK